MPEAQKEVRLPDREMRVWVGVTMPPEVKVLIGKGHDAEVYRVCVCAQQRRSKMCQG